MKSKYVGGFLGIIFGVFGTHKFYLGNSSAGFFRFGLFAFALVSSFKFIIPILSILGFIEGILLLSMSQREFDLKYNEQAPGESKSRRPQRREYHHRQREKAPAAPRRPVSNPHKREGIDKYKDYDYQGAIQSFQKALAIEPEDVATHFNIACAYSLTEQTQKAFYHISKAVENGFSDYDKIQHKEAFAYLRVQPEFEEFAKNGYRLPQEEPKDVEAPKQIEAPKPGLLDDELTLKKLEKLGELRDKGLITEEEFAREKRRLME